MDLMVKIINGIGVIDYPICPGTYTIDVIRMNGFEPDLYSGSSGEIVTEITLQPAQSTIRFNAVAHGAAVVKVRKRLSNGTIEALPVGALEGLPIYRLALTGKPLRKTIDLDSNNSAVFANLPYEVNTMGEAVGPIVTFMIDENTIPAEYQLYKMNKISKRIVSEVALETEFVFEVVDMVDATFHIYDANSPISNVISEEGNGIVNGFEGITSGELTLTPNTVV